MKIDYRSDTFTKPSPAMLQAMISAEVGDDVFGEDPTVKQLETMLSDQFGMEAGIFCPSGTMANQIAIKTHTQPGDEVICERLSHIYLYEAGGIAFNSGCQVNLIEGERGIITAAQIEKAINPVDLHRANTRLVSLENTSNRGGGTCYEFTDFKSIKEVCLKYNLKLHLDGSRVWNAIVEKEESPIEYGKIFDSISICLSKGLGAPIGTVLLGSHEFINRAKKIRKIFGGGMRQSGYLAAAGIYALKNNIERLKQDHLNARLVADCLSKKDFIGKIVPVETNIIIFEVLPPYTPKSFVGQLQKFDIHCLPISETQVRMITHLDITDEMINKTIEIIKAL